MHSYKYYLVIFQNHDSIEAVSFETYSATSLPEALKMHLKEEKGDDITTHSITQIDP